MLSIVEKIPQRLWDVIVETEEKYGDFVPTQEHKALVEEKAIVTIFDGGCFLSNGPEFDLYVAPERQGKWKIRGTINAFVRKILDEYGTAIVKINPKNKKSLRLALGFGFVPTGKDGIKITLEVKK